MDEKSLSAPPERSDEKFWHAKLGGNLTFFCLVSYVMMACYVRLREEKKVWRGGKALETERFTLIDHFTNKHLNE